MDDRASAVSRTEDHASCSMADGEHTDAKAHAGLGKDDVELEPCSPKRDDSIGDVDAEKGGSSPQPRPQRSEAISSTQQPEDVNAISWNGPDDPENPKNWQSKRKWVALLTVSCFTFISPVASSMTAPALPQMKRDLHIREDILVQMSLSIFLLALAFGAMILAPLSELFGRTRVLQLGNLFFLLFNTACGAVETTSAIIACRFFAGLGGSAPLAVGGGVLADLFPPEERGKAIAIQSLAPLLGPAIGPVLGGLIAGSSNWRWVFWAVSLFGLFVQILGFFFLQETWAPVLLERKVKKLRKESGNTLLYSAAATNESLRQKLARGLVRPCRLLFTQPIVICAALFMGYLYGLVYLVISSFASLYTSARYGQSVQAAGLHYIALGLGYLIGALSTARLNDVIYRRQKLRNNGVGCPEFRVPVLIPCVVLLPIGFFFYGWSAQEGVFWVVPDLGALIISAATIAGYQGMQSYVIDCYTVYAASAMAAISLLRSLAGFAFPLFAPLLYQRLDYGWGNSLLAFVAVGVGLPAPWLFWRYGPGLRAKSQFAAG